MDPEEIKKDLKEILDLASKRDSNVTKTKIIPSAHAILAEQEDLKKYRESLAVENDLNVIQEEDPQLEKFTNLIMAVTQHDEYNENDDENMPSSSAKKRECKCKAEVRNQENISEEKPEEIDAKQSQLKQFTDLVMAVTEHDVYNENDDDFIKAPTLPRGESETTLKADSTENLNVEHKKEEEQSLEVHFDLENSAKNKGKEEVELEVELQVKVNSESNLDAIAEALKNITFITTRVTESTPKTELSHEKQPHLPEQNESLLLGTESECLECALYGYESVEEIEEVKPNDDHKDFNEDIGTSISNYATDKSKPNEDDERISPVTTYLSIDEKENHKTPNHKAADVDSIARALKNVEFSPSTITIKVFKDPKEHQDELSETDSQNQQPISSDDKLSTATKVHSIDNQMIDITSSVMPQKIPKPLETPQSDDKMFDITSSVVPDEHKSTITFLHEFYDSKATFSMQPEKIETKPSGAEYLFGQSKPHTEKKQRHDCNCEIKVTQQQKDFEEVMRRATEVIEKIERESQAVDEAASVEETIKNVEEKFESELQENVPRISSRIDLRSFSKTVVDGIKNENKRICHCFEKREKRKQDLEELFEAEDVGVKVDLPVTSMAKSLLSTKTSQISHTNLNDEENDSLESKEEVVNVESFDESPIVKRLKEIIFGGLSVEDKTEEKFSKVQFNFQNPKTIRRDSEFFRSCPCLESKESIKPESSSIKQKIQEFEILSAKSSAVSLKPIKSQTSILTVMTVEIPKGPKIESSSKASLNEKSQKSEGEVKSENLIESVELVQDLNIEEISEDFPKEPEKEQNEKLQKAPSEKELKCCLKRKSQYESEGPKFAAPPPSDIEELPSSSKFKRSSKNRMETLSEEKELDRFYNKMLMMDDESQRKTQRVKIEDQNDDDGFSKLPNVPSSALSKVSSSAWIDENISFIVNDQEAEKKTTRVSLAFGYPRENQNTSHKEDADKECSPSTSNESSSSMGKFVNRLRQCKCIMKRISKSITGKK